MIERRELLAGSMALTALSLSHGCIAAKPSRPDIGPDIKEIEGKGRLGVCVLDTKTGAYCGHRLQEHFVMCSTFKLPLAGVILREADLGRINLDEVLPYTKADMVANSPITEANMAKGGMRIVDLAHATQTTSDNVAANLLTRKLGGPQALTEKWRAIGDKVTRCDRYEPDANFVLSADLRDTTTPLAMAQMVANFTIGDLLKPSSRAMLLQWMEETKTGTRRIRGGLPMGWRAGDKTGTGFTKGMTDKYNDVAITFPPEQAPIIIAAYYDTGRQTDDFDNAAQAVLADVGRIAARWVMATS